MKMKSDRPLLVDGVPQTEFETSEHHGKELIAKGLAVEVVSEPAVLLEPVVAVESKPVAPPPRGPAAAKPAATPKNK